MKHPGGRPSEYKPETADIICERLSLGESLNRITSCESMPSIATVYRWMREHPEFLKKYEDARLNQVDTLADEMIDIADDASNDYIKKTNSDGSEYETVNAEHIQRSRLRVDTRKWIAERMKPKKYGPKSDVTLTAKVTQMPMVKIGDEQQELDIGDHPDPENTGDAGEVTSADPTD